MAAPAIAGAASAQTELFDQPYAYWFGARARIEPTKKAVLETKAKLDKLKITEQQAALCEAAGQSFYNTSRFTLRDLKSRGNQQQLQQDFLDYLDGFSSNVQGILTNFEFRDRVPRLSKADALGTLISKFLNPDIFAKSRKEELRTCPGRHPAHLRHLPHVQGNRAIEDFPEQSLWL